MSTKLVQDSSLTAVANAIRSKTGGSELLEFPDDFVTEIGSIGSSDFSTVQMTVTGDTGSFTVYPASGNDEYECAFINSNNKFAHEVYAPQGESVTVTVMFMGDSAIVTPFNVVKSVTGDATYDQETGLITATGDFTVAGFIDD